jgi:hypothetical protein
MLSGNGEEVVGEIAKPAGDQAGDQGGLAAAGRGREAEAGLAPGRRPSMHDREPVGPLVQPLQDILVDGAHDQAGVAGPQRLDAVHQQGCFLRPGVAHFEPPLGRARLRFEIVEDGADEGTSARMLDRERDPPSRDRADPLVGPDDIGPDGGQRGRLPAAILGIASDQARGQPDFDQRRGFSGIVRLRAGFQRAPDRFRRAIVGEKMVPACSEQEKPSVEADRHGIGRRTKRHRLIRSDAARA